MSELTSKGVGFGIVEVRGSGIGPCKESQGLLTVCGSELKLAKPSLGLSRLPARLKYIFSGVLSNDC